MSNTQLAYKSGPLSAFCWWADSDLRQYADWVEPSLTDVSIVFECIIFYFKELLFEFVILMAEYKMKLLLREGPYGPLCNALMTN